MVTIRKFTRSILRRQHALWLGVALGVFCLLPATLPPANAAGTPMVSGSIIRDFARITFYWTRKAGFNAEMDGNRLIIRFDRQVNPDFSTILQSLHPYVTKAELLSNREAIVFTLNKPYKIRTFITETETGVDILGVLNEDEPSPVPQQRIAQNPVQAPTNITPKKPEPKPEPKTEPKPEPQKPVEAPRNITPQKQVAEAKPTPEKPVEAPSNIVPKKQVAETQPTPKATPAPQQPTHQKASYEPAPITGDPLKVELIFEDAKPTLLFPWIERVAAAVWARNNVIWVSFNKPVTLTNLDEIADATKSWLISAKQIGHKEATILRLETKATLSPIAYKDPSGYAWKVSVTAEPSPPEKTVSPEFNTGAEEPFLFLSLTQTRDSYEMRDPDIGDHLHIVPMYASSTGFNPGRVLADLALLETAQGVVIVPIADQVKITHLRNGIRVSAPGGLFISSNLPAVEPTVAIEATPIEGSEKFKPTLFPNAKWLAMNTEGFNATTDYLLYEILRAPSMLKRNLWRKKLAEHYLSAGFTPETLGVLDRIRREDLDFYLEEKLAAYEGAAHLLNYRPEMAATSFASSSLDDAPEADLLRKATNAALVADAEAVPYMELNDAYIRQYPLALRQRIAILAANHAIRTQDYITPLKIFDSLKSDNATEGVEDYITFLRANIAAEVGREDEAKQLWTQLSEKADDRQFRARSEYALILLGMRNGSIKPDEAIARLDRLRIVWRGDDLEMSLLMLLGQLNVNQGDYWEGLKAWEELLQFYPNTPDAIAAYTRMSETFKELFLQDGAKEMSPLKALSLYDEFKELTPLGDEGNKMVQNLVDKLVEADLLEQAAARLENQIDYRLKGQEKSVIGARLALIHLLNREPAKALLALQKTRIENVPASLSLERNRLAAKALLEFDKPDQALTMIEGDYSPKGESVRLEAYWAQSDWANVIDMIELILARRPNLDKNFTAEEGQQILRLALSYIFLGEYNQMGYLQRAYGERMKGNPYEEEFNFLTQERIPLNHKDFQQVATQISGIEGFMDTFRKKIDASALSNAIAPPLPNEPAAGATELEKPIPEVGQSEAAELEEAEDEE